MDAVIVPILLMVENQPLSKEVISLQLYSRLQKLWEQKSSLNRVHPAEETTYFA